MIPKVDTGFRKRSCSNNNLERDDDSKKSHHALEPDTDALGRRWGGPFGVRRHQRAGRLGRGGLLGVCVAFALAGFGVRFRVSLAAVRTLALRAGEAAEPLVLYFQLDEQFL